MIKIMKKKSRNRGNQIKFRLGKTFLIMKLTIFFYLVSAISIYASSVYSQNAKITLDLKNVSIKTVLMEIEESSNYFFIYNNELIDVDRLVEVHAKDKKISEILNEIFENEDVEVSLIGKKIILFPKSKNTKQIIVTGKVIDSNDGLPLPGVNITIEGASGGAITDMDGKFSVEVPDPNATLIFSYLGFTTQAVALEGKTTIDIVMQESEENLDEVVVIGYGTQNKKSLTGAMSVVSSKEFEGRQNTQFGNALEGKIAGVQITKPSGQPQSGYKIKIRGTSTITAGSVPLYILDGVPTTSINEINPADIESMTILKDASSSAIYGASGSNGVVLITTKRGANQKTKVTFDTYFGMGQVWKKLDVLNADQYKALMTEMGQSTDWSLYPYDNYWQDQVFRTSHTQNYQLGISGGSDKTNYYISGSYIDQQGIVITNELQRYNFKVNLDHKVSKWFKVGTSISYNKWKDIDVSENSKYGSINSALTGAPVTDVYNADGTFAIHPFIQDLENPVALLLKDKHSYQNYRFNGNFYLEANILEKLKFKSMVGVEHLNGTYNSWVDPYRSREGRGFSGMASLVESQSSYWIYENTLNYTTQINKHAFSALAGFVASNKAYSGSWIDAKGFGSGAVPTINAGSIRTASADESQRRNTAFISRINYGYDDKYLLTVNFRADGSSVFGAGNRWGYFPSFSAGWRISKESFFQGLDFINDMKFRAGWGIVGNDQIGDYSSYGLISPGSFYVFGGSVVPGTSITSMENSDLRWETTKQTNIGLDMALLNNRLTFTTDYYIKQTSDMLLNAPIPASVGIPGNTATKNVGEMENRGIEFQVSSKNLISDLKWTTDFNISFNKSKIIKLDKSVPIRTGYISDRGNVAIAMEGEELGLFYGYISEGVNPETGDLVFKDMDKSGTLNDADQTIIGNSNPKFTFGLTNSFSYKNFSFSFFFLGVEGNDIFNASRIENEGLFDEANQLSTVLNRWTAPGQVTDMPRSNFGDNHNSLISSRYIEDGSYIRLKSATLGYELPIKYAEKLKMSRLFIYVTGENLFTFTKYSGFDPEVDLYGTSGDNTLINIAPGVDYGTYPQSREFIVGLNITF